VNETHEPSYYEIALTNRQVMVVFVVLLMSVIAAFLSGVWVGREEPGERTVIAQRTRPIVASVGDADGGDSEVRSLNFFTDQEPSEPTAPLAKIVEEPRKDTTLLEDVGGTPPAIVEEPAPKKPAPEKPRPSDQEVASRVASSPPPPKPQPQAERQVERRVEPPAPRPIESLPPAVADGFVVQVFSSGDQRVATGVRDKLRSSGYTAFLSPVDVNAQTMYRVRVGPYPARSEAENTASRVQRVFKYETWITR